MIERPNRTTTRNSNRRTTMRRTIERSSVPLRATPLGTTSLLPCAGHGPAVEVDRLPARPIERHAIIATMRSVPSDLGNYRAAFCHNFSGGERHTRPAGAASR